MGDDTRVFNGVDVTFNVRSLKSFTFSGGTSTGKVTNDWCAVRAVVPEAFLLNPYCNPSSPFQTVVSRPRELHHPARRCDYQRRVPGQARGQQRDRPAPGSFAANYTLTAADQAAAAAQIGRPLTVTGPITVNLIAPGQVYGDRVRQLDLSFKKILHFGSQRLTAGLDIYNVMNNSVTLVYNYTYSPTSTGWLQPTTYMNPRVFRLNAEWSW